MQVIDAVFVAGELVRRAVKREPASRDAVGEPADNASHVEAMFQIFVAAAKTENDVLRSARSMDAQPLDRRAPGQDRDFQVAAAQVDAVNGGAVKRAA